MREFSKRGTAWLRRIVAHLIGILISATAALACSTVALGPPGARLVAYSYDTSETGAGLIFANPGGGWRRSIMEGNAARWEVLHGSVTFNHLGYGMPTTGMNTAGLVVSLMWNDAARYPPPEGRAHVNELEFIQRLLDRAATVEEVRGVIGEVAIQDLVPIHFFVADATGATAAITPDGAALRVHSGAEMPVPALTNTSYADALAALPTLTGFGGTRAIPAARTLDEAGSLGRFAISARAADDGGAPTAETAFAVLEDLRNKHTHWQIAFAPAARAITFRLTAQRGEWRIDLDNLKVSCATGPLSANLAGLGEDAATAAFAPADPVQATALLEDVLRRFEGALRLPPEAAGPITKAQFASLECRE
ncbi:MAG: linear amide C-N hydrolase [Pseudomonadota bacterium]